MFLKYVNGDFGDRSENRKPQTVARGRSVNMIIRGILQRRIVR